LPATRLGIYTLHLHEPVMDIQVKRLAFSTEASLNFIHCLKPQKSFFLKEHHGLYQRSRPYSLKGPVLEIEIDQQQLRVEKVLDYPEFNAITF